MKQPKWILQVRPTGFTLIELLIVVAIVGILAAIAVPSYFQYIKQSQRADAKTALLQDVQFLERNFTEANSYSKQSDGTTDVTLPTPPSSVTDHYTITSTLTASTFSITATPSSDPDCGVLSIDHLGQKTVTGSAGVAQCWDK
jgi:type IV pilus assembly protein PilE